ncbi:hypothetical protein HanRHA438_Chr10g0475441 [Helianthus annuus]|uniref:Uncharacterized protein n=1 Tax=Helianthus annuus TaxID=4232 RepID=A0A9K3I1P6_HELAN|nr:hypothetical protein HanXRQr2_Chr10g0462961 [Helianthus annuus]KAJ0523904.1 hypothetical protein HanIR_Chr10g0498821 [Helianthus annuus]KAJ0531586.1 hypothetical protein HanHA89_Chr10g0402661 [Helianthus annuus]KAJ0698421.1 hypothetical protein HanLR1_Chr10g0379821 [Helianthus annuus]KAJ0701771.1 hypothetical protein HanOQP8_Chr10g0383041 [Helianthus annuus]
MLHMTCSKSTLLADVAYDLLKEYSELARTKYIRAPLWCIAKKWDTYPSAQRYNFYQRFVYFHVPIDNKGVDQTNKINDIENQEICMSNLITQCTKSYVYPGFMSNFGKLYCYMCPISSTSRKTKRNTI